MYYREMSVAELKESMKQAYWGRRYLVESTEAGWVRISRSPLIPAPATEPLYRRATDAEAVDLFACTKFDEHITAECPHQCTSAVICLCNFPAGTIDPRDGSNPLIPVN